MEQKAKHLLEYSNPIQVSKNATKMLGKDVEVYISSRKTKKYMVQSPDGKWIHFGAMGYKDGTLNDADKENRIKRFKSRNFRWYNSTKWTPAYLAAHLLW